MVTKLTVLIVSKYARESNPCTPKRNSVLCCVSIKREIKKGLRNFTFLKLLRAVRLTVCVSPRLRLVLAHFDGRAL